jgi:hypothetical protein
MNLIGLTLAFIILYIISIAIVIFSMDAKHKYEMDELRKELGGK